MNNLLLLFGTCLLILGIACGTPEQSSTDSKQQHRTFTKEQATRPLPPESETEQQPMQTSAEAGQVW